MPIRLLFGSVLLTTFTSSYEVLGLVRTYSLPEWKRVDMLSPQLPPVGQITALSLMEYNAGR